MENQLNTDVVIIGAGLTGLTMAFYLKEAGMRVRILEKQNRVGGVIQTVQENGFVYEAGPNTGAILHPEVAELFHDLLGNCELEVAAEGAKKRLIWKKGKWHALPSGPVSAIKTPLFSFKDKLRILGEPFRSAGTDPFESVGDMVIRRLGESYLKYAVDPFISGVYAGDPFKLVTRFALPKLYNLEQAYGSFIKGALKKKKEPKSERMLKATREVFSVKGGLQNLITALEKMVKEEICVGCENVYVKPDKKQYIISYTKDSKSYNISSKWVITTFGGPGLIPIFPFLKKEKLNTITNMTYAKICLAVVGFKNWEWMDIKAFGGLVPSVENRQILGILFPSSIFELRAPEKGALLSVFIGGVKKPFLVDLPDDQVYNMIKKELTEMMKIDRFNPDLFKIFRYHQAIPQYDYSSEERLRNIAEIEEKYPGLILGGNIRDGIGMADRIKQGKQLAEEVVSYK